MDIQYEFDLEHHNVASYIYSGPESAERIISLSRKWGSAGQRVR